MKTEPLQTEAGRDRRRRGASVRGQVWQDAGILAVGQHAGLSNMRSGKRNGC